MGQPVLTHLPADTDVATAVDVIERDGGVVIDDFLSPEQVAALAADLDVVMNKTKVGVDEEFAGKRTKRVGALFAHSRHTQDIALHPIFLAVAKKILQKPIHIWLGEKRSQIVPDIGLGVTQAIQIGSGEGRQPLHRDDMVFLWRHPGFGREARVQVMVAINDFTAENGGTRVIPGSHRWDDERMPTDDEAISTVMRAGSALIFIGSVYHGGGTNTTDQPRLGVTLAYDLGVLRQEENHYLSLPAEVVKRYPEELRRLLGWSAGENLMGYVVLDGVMSDPYPLLEGDEYHLAAEIG